LTQVRDGYFECINLAIEQAVEPLPPVAPTGSLALESKQSSAAGAADTKLDAQESSGPGGATTLVPAVVVDAGVITVPSPFCSSSTLYILDCLNFDLRSADLAHLLKFLPFLTGLILYPCASPPASESQRAFFARNGQAATRFVSPQVAATSFFSTFLD